MNNLDKNFLFECLDEDEVVALSESFGGTRLYIAIEPEKMPAVVKAIGLEAAKRLSAFYSPDVIRVPLSRSLRANHYRAAGMSNRQIARRLEMTETGVNRMLRQLEREGILSPKGSKPLPKAQNLGGRCPCCQHYNPDRVSTPADPVEPLEDAPPT